MTDTIDIQILEDGTIKSTTDPISAANHQTAEQFMRDLTTLTGGPTKRERRAGTTHTHHHHHHHQTQK